MTQPVVQRGMKVDVLVVGAGYAGSVVAERLASAGRWVMVVDKRPHVGGTAYDAFDEHGVLIHRGEDQRRHILEVRLRGVTGRRGESRLSSDSTGRASESRLPEQRRQVFLEVPGLIERFG